MGPTMRGTGVTVHASTHHLIKKNPKPFSLSVSEQSHRSLYNVASGGIGGIGLTLIMILIHGDVINLEWREMTFLHGYFSPYTPRIYVQSVCGLHF